MLLREEHEEALLPQQDLIEEAHERHPDDGRHIHAAHGRDEAPRGAEHGLRGRVRQGEWELAHGQLRVPRHDDAHDEEEIECCE